MRREQRPCVTLLIATSDLETYFVPAALDREKPAGVNRPAWWQVSVAVTALAVLREWQAAGGCSFPIGACDRSI
jgi:hypothetical protein